MIHPPSVGPRVGPTMTPIPKMAMAVPASSRGKTSNRMACAVEISAPPPMPWTMRQNTRLSSVPALPQKYDATVKRTMDPV